MKVNNAILNVHIACMSTGFIRSCVQDRSNRKERGSDFPTPQDLVARVRARDQALGAGGGGPALTGRPPQRHIEQRGCEGVWGAKLPELFSFFWYSLERTLILQLLWSMFKAASYRLFFHLINQLQTFGR
jgi:hypothetical protein